MRRHSALLFLLLGVCLAAPAATLQYLSLSDMTADATTVVLGTVVGSHTTVRGPVVYTVYSLQVAERLKGRSPATIDIAVPGGVADGIRQTFAGAPELQNGSQYLVFAWRSKSGLNMILGLSQGLFSITPGSSGSDPGLIQTATAERVVNGSGVDIATTPLRMSLSQMRSTVRRLSPAEVQ